MPTKSFNVRRVEGSLPPRRNATQLLNLGARKISKQSLADFEVPRNFASAALETVLLAALRHSFNARKAEDGLTHVELARRCGRHRSAVSKIMHGRDWRLSTLSDVVEALDLRMEFAFVDLKRPSRRFTARGARYVELQSSDEEAAG